MKIGEIARRVGIPIDTVRYYERGGLLPPPARRASGYRDYDDGDIPRLRFILRAKALGFTLVEIRELLDLSDEHAGNVGDLKLAVQAKLADIESRMAQLAKIHDALNSMIAACPGDGSVIACPIRSALFNEEVPAR